MLLAIWLGSLGREELCYTALRPSAQLSRMLHYMRGPSHYAKPTLDISYPSLANINLYNARRKDNYNSPIVKGKGGGCNSIPLQAETEVLGI